MKIPGEPGDITRWNNQSIGFLVTASPQHLSVWIFPRSTAQWKLKWWNICFEQAPSLVNNGFYNIKNDKLVPASWILTHIHKTSRIHFQVRPVQTILQFQTSAGYGHRYVDLDTSGILLTKKVTSVVARWGATSWVSPAGLQQSPPQKPRFWRYWG